MSFSINLVSISEAITENTGVLVAASPQLDAGRGTKAGRNPPEVLFRVLT